MSFAAIAPIVGGVLAGAGSAAGGKKSQPETPDYNSSFYYPGSDPALAGISTEAMIGLGMPPTMILEQAGPLAQVKNYLNMNPAISNDDKRNAMNKIAAIEQNLSKDQQLYENLTAEEYSNWRTNAVMSVVRSVSDIDLDRAGITRDQVEEILVKEIDYRRWTEETLGKIESGQENIFDARLDAQRAIGNLTGELAGQFGGASGQPGPTASGFMRNLEADINTTYDKQLEDVMRIANTAGFNPGRAISDLEDSRASALRNLPQTGALQAGQIISLLQGTLAPAQDLAGKAAAIRSGQGVGAASVAGNQASAINQIQATINAQQAQAAGAGIAGAGAALGNAATIAALMSQGPGTANPSYSQYGPYNEASGGYQFPNLLVD